jgi:hypothetical protein
MAWWCAYLVEERCSSGERCSGASRRRSTTDLGKKWLVSPTWMARRVPPPSPPAWCLLDEPHRIKSKFGDLDAHVSKRVFEGPLGERGDALKPFVRHRAPLASEGGLARLSVSGY